MIYQTSDPTKIIDTVASFILKGGNDNLANKLVFVPTRRAGRTLEKMLSEKSGGAVMLPQIVPLGEGFDDEDENKEIIGNTERRIALAKIILSVSEEIHIPNNFSGALSVATELIRLQDYLENEGLSISDIDWNKVIDNEQKVKFINLIKHLDLGKTSSQIRNEEIRKWVNHLHEYDYVYCCGSTASVKSTRDLMEEIYKLPNGFIIFPGLVTNMDDVGRTDPYWSIKRFLVGKKIETMEIGGDERIQFFNNAFANILSEKKPTFLNEITEINCDTENEEANVVAAISSISKNDNKSVLVITPDVSGEQRIKNALSRFGLSADSSSGKPLRSTEVGKFCMLLFSFLCGTENKDVVACDLLRMTSIKDRNILNSIKYKGTLLNFIVFVVNTLGFDIRDDEGVNLFFEKIFEISGIADKYNLGLPEIQIVVNEMLGSETVRAPMDKNYDVTILGTAEARMQTADVVILTGLNDGMFPSYGFEHSWLPRDIAHKIGLPSADSKVSLMALDFITLSCGKEVYWTRAKMSSGAETIQSRFLSRVAINGTLNYDRGLMILNAVRAMDSVPSNPISTDLPFIKYSGDYYATWLEDLIHNPYLFYAKHILNLKTEPDIGDDIGAKEFGTLVHSVIEKLGATTDLNVITRMLEDAALNYVERDSVLFRFWQNRFHEMAPVISELNKVPAELEKKISMSWNGRNLIARADRVESTESGGVRVLDYKTGSVPSDSQLGLSKDKECTMPQLPVEAMILSETNQNVGMAFVSLKKGNVGIKEYDSEKTARTIAAVKEKFKVIMNYEKYERYEFVEEKYRDFDDLCREGD